MNKAKDNISKVRTCLWFDDQGQEAAEFYVSLLPDSHIETAPHSDSDVSALVVEFTLAGAPYMALSGGPHFTHSPAASIVVLTEDQNEKDTLWNQLTADGGQAGHCGWLTDRFSVSWQIVPRVLGEMLNADDKEAAARAREAMLEMSKIEVAVLAAAFNNNSTNDPVEEIS